MPISPTGRAQAVATRLISRAAVADHGLHVFNCSTRLLIGHTCAMRIPGPSGFSSTRFLSTPGRVCRAVLLALSALAPVDAAPTRPKSGRPAPIPSPTSSAASASPAPRGIGTKDDPIVITEELNSATPVTLIIRTTKPIQPFGTGGRIRQRHHVYAHRRAQQQRPGLGRVRVRAAGDPGPAERVRRRACRSTSATRRPDNIWSSNFADFDRDFEPYDRLLFKDGKVDPLKTASFEFPGHRLHAALARSIWCRIRAYRRRDLQTPARSCRIAAHADECAATMTAASPNSRPMSPTLLRLLCQRRRRRGAGRRPGEPLRRGCAEACASARRCAGSAAARRQRPPERPTARRTATPSRRCRMRRRRAPSARRGARRRRRRRWRASWRRSAATLDELRQQHGGLRRLQSRNSPPRTWCSPTATRRPR